MVRRRSSPIDLFVTEMPTSLNTGSRFPLRVHSPTHSRPGRPVHFNLAILKGTGDFGRVIAREFLEFAKVYQKATADSHLIALRSFLVSFVGELQGENTELQSVTSGRWRQFAAVWFYDLKSDAALSDITANGYLSSNRMFFNHLQKRHMVPKFRWPSPVPCARGTPRPAVSSVNATSVQDALLKSWDEIDRAAWAELLLLNDLASPTTVKKRSSIILRVVRHYAQKEIRKWWGIFQESKKLIIDNKSFDFIKYCEKYEYTVNGELKRKRGWRDELKSLSNLLVYVDRKFDGVMPGKNDDPHFVKCAYHYHSNSLKGRFHLEYEFLTSLLTLILLERPKMNLASPLSMKRKDFSKITVGEHQARWTKARAKYRRLSDDLPSGCASALRIGSNANITAAQALRVIDVLSRPLQAKALPGEDDQLVLVRDTFDGRAVGKSANPQWISKQWIMFRSRSGLLSALGFTLSQFRPTGAIGEFFTSGDIFKVADLLGQKDIRITARYIDNLAADTVDAGAVRPVQDSLTIALGRRTGRSLRELGISPEREAHIRQAAFSSGFLGYNLTGTPGEAKAKVDALESILCGSKFLIVETAEVAAEIIAFKEHIVANGKAIKGTTRYEEFWLPLIAVCTQIIELMAASVIRDAKKLLAERPIFYGPVL